jgi:hypothetical protein
MPRLDVPEAMAQIQPPAALAAGLQHGGVSDQTPEMQVDKTLCWAQDRLHSCLAAAVWSGKRAENLMQPGANSTFHSSMQHRMRASSCTQHIRHGHGPCLIRCCNGLNPDPNRTSR